MNFNEFKKYQSLIIFIVLLVFMAFSLWFRGLSAYSMDLLNYTGYASPDVWYNFRLVEVVIHNFPSYPWFDPMTAYPVGKEIDWGPLLATTGAGIAILSGMTTRAEMMNLVSWIGPVFAAALVPVMYYIGKILWNWKAGLIAAGLITILSPLYFVNTSFGYFDHHGLETFFSTLFCLLYIVAIVNVKRRIGDVRNVGTLMVLTCLLVATGLVYFCGYVNMPTMILFGLVVAVYTILQFIFDTIRKKPTEYLLFTNIGIFIPVFVFMVLFGIRQEGMDLQKYTIGQPVAILVLIGVTALFYLLSRYLGSDKKLFFTILVGILAAGLAANYLAFNNLFIGTLFNFFGQGVESSAIIESKPWTLGVAFDSFGVALLLGLIGFLILLYYLYKEKRNVHLFAAVWTLVAFVATLQHLRYEYYFVVNMAILSSLCIIVGFTTGMSWIRGSPASPDRDQATRPDIDTTDKKPDSSAPKKSGKKNKDRKVGPKRTSAVFGRTSIRGYGLVFIIVLLTAVTVATSIGNDYLYSTSPDRLMNKDWVGTLEWLPLHSPDPGIDYLGLYQVNNFTYPKNSYGILAWWDYGHYITFISKRIPNTNPFQDNLIGSHGVAAFFLSDSEANATSILKSLGARYVITDTSLTTIKFVTLTDWYSGNGLGPNAYMNLFYLKNPLPNGPWIQIKGELMPYYNTTVVRLQNFDGSMMVPKQTIYGEYHIENQNGIVYPIASKFQLLDKNDTVNALKSFNAGNRVDDAAIEVGQYLYPLGNVPALTHFRLVYESPGNSSSLTFTDVSGIPELNYVKVFEYVPGARINGTGTIEVQVITNTGRSFLYRQQSANGEFIVPYSTKNNPYDVKTNGGYRIVGTDRTINVDEESVQKGSYVV